MDPFHKPLQSSGARPIHPQRNSFPDPHSPSSSNGFPATNRSMPVPNRPPGIHGHPSMYDSRGQTGPLSSNGFGSKSPPNAPSQKNTKHVPCKFFYKGQCAAGDTCPYSHAPEPPEPCKFFINGNCKYNQHCALPHYAPDGSLLNPQCLGTYRAEPRRSRAGNRRGFNGGMSTTSSDIYSPTSPQQAPLDRHVPYRAEYNGDYGSPPGSNFGSPPFDSHLGRSPPFRSALDAPLPPSFSSQDLPNIQKFGPNATSVPNNGGLGPLMATSPTTSALSRDAFSNIDSALNEGIERLDLGSSPHDTRAEVGPRHIHSSTRTPVTRDFPASLPVHERHELFRGMDRQIQADDNHEEDFLPSALSDLLTPQEKMRRFSRSHDDPSSSDRPAQGGLVGSPSSKIGSPSGASPSRFSGFFAEQAKRDGGGQMGSSPFGHVGSPLRNSSFPSHITKAADGGGHSPSFGPISPPGFKERPGSVSSLSEQLRKARTPSMPDQQSSNKDSAVATGFANRSVSGPTLTPSRKDRVMSSGSGPERIEEEDPCFFSMEDERMQ